MQIHWVQIWASNNFPLSSLCPQVCKNWLPNQQELAQTSISCTHSAVHTALCHQLTRAFRIFHIICTECQIVYGMCEVIPLSSDPGPPHMLPLFESHCLCFAVLVGFYLQFTMVFLLMGPSNTLLSILLTMAISTSSDLIIYHLGWSWSLWIKYAYLVYISVPSHFDNYRIACLAIFLFQIILHFLKMLCVFEIIWYSALIVLIDSKSVGIFTWHTSSWGSFHMYRQNKCLVTFTVRTFPISKTDK